MADIIRESALGYVLSTATRGRLFVYTKNKPDFQLPATYVAAARDDAPEKKEAPSDSDGAFEKSAPMDADHIPDEPAVDLTRASTASTTTSSHSSHLGHGAPQESMRAISKAETHDQRLDLQKVVTTKDLEKAVTAATARPEPTRPIIPTKTADGVVLVDWYTTDDPDNPQNWSGRKKGFVTAQICLYTMAVYMGSSIYTASEPAIIEIFGTTQTVASLGLALYVLGYGTGPLLFSPLSEIPSVGRNPPYILSLIVFVLLWIPAGLVNNVPGLLVLRFLQGFFGSPCLATAGATLGDMYNILQLPYLMTIWVSAATMGPSLGPLISGFSVPALDWHWSFWEILILSGPVWGLMFVAMPETSAPNILLRRARRLRKQCGNPQFRSQSELDQAKMTTSDIVRENLLHPAEITVKDPAVLFATLYTAFCYAIYYSFFEFFPAVFVGMHGFNLGQLGLAFLCITVSIVLAVVGYFTYIYTRVNPKIVKEGLGDPEFRLVPALGLSVTVPVGLFIFAWTSREDLPWVAPLIGVGLYNISIFLIFQCIFMYIPFVYPQFAASVRPPHELRCLQMLTERTALRGQRLRALRAKFRLDPLRHAHGGEHGRLKGCHFARRSQHHRHSGHLGVVVLGPVAARPE